MSEENNFRIMSGLLCGAILFGIFFMVAYLGEQLGGADCLIVAAIGYRGPILDYKNKELLNFYFTELKKIAKKEHVYPLVPFLTVGYIITLIILIIQGQHISWLL